MQFGRYPLEKAIGGIIAHSIRLPESGSVRKGAILDEELVDKLCQAGVHEVVVAIPERGDVLEDQAAKKISECLGGRGLRTDEAKTGRVNFFATSNSIFRVDAELVNTINALDPGITIATLPDCSEVNSGRMVATVKIIPYGVSEIILKEVETICTRNTFSCVGFVSKRVGMISTRLSGTKDKVLDKTRRSLEKRLSRSGSKIVEEKRIDHAEEEITAAIDRLKPQCDIIILFGASAISDRRDVVPAAIENAGGKIIRFGMPVDPGNLLLLAELDKLPVVGAPGCARSIAENGFDWILQRLLADIPVTSQQIAQMGVGGLLMETGARPHRREANLVSYTTSAIVMAAGQSRRMGKQNKLLADFNGKPMVRHVVEAAIASQLDKVIVVVGFEAELVKAALTGLSCEFVENKNFADGMSTSLVRGISALSKDTGAALVLLGDMPFVKREEINKMLGGRDQGLERITVATSSGKRGNPVLWPARFFEDLMRIEGDVGARHIIGAHADLVDEVEIGDAAGEDIDTPTALQHFANPSATKTG